VTIRVGIRHDGRVWSRRRLNRLPALAAAATMCGCGLDVTSPDLFALTRTGAGTRLAIVVSDGGTIRCNGGRARSISDAMLLRARALVTNLDKDAKAHLRVAGPPGVFSYTIRMQDGTVSFPDTGALAHHELAAAEQFALEAERGPCAA
jgi:hypothetical protein